MNLIEPLGEHVRIHSFNFFLGAATFADCGMTGSDRCFLPGGNADSLFDDTSKSLVSSDDSVGSSLPRGDVMHMLVLPSTASAKVCTCTKIARKIIKSAGKGMDCLHCDIPSPTLKVTQPLHTVPQRPSHWWYLACTVTTATRGLL